MVIGPTPPGTGVIAPATSSRFVEGDVAEQLARAVGLLDALLADVDDRRAGLEPVAADHLGPADGGDDDVGAAHRRRAGRGCANGRRSPCNLA